MRRSQDAHEDTPLLADCDDAPQESESKPRPTPLPWRQLSIVLLLQLVEPLTAQVIVPFLPQVRWPTYIRSMDQWIEFSFPDDTRHRCYPWRRIPGRILCRPRGQSQVLHSHRQLNLSFPTAYFILSCPSLYSVLLEPCVRPNRTQTSRPHRIGQLVGVHVLLWRIADVFGDDIEVIPCTATDEKCVPD